MASLNKTARTAGLLYLILVLLGFFYLRFAVKTLFVIKDPAELFDVISRNELLFRFEVLAEMVADVIFILMALVLYRLFNGVQRTYTVLMVVFVAFSVFISYIGIQHKLDILSLIDKPAHAAAFSKAQIQQQVMLHIDFYRNTILSGEFFWGLWLMPLGLLILRSHFIPSVFGIVLMIGCFGYVADFAASLLFPEFSKTPVFDYITIPASLGELGTCLWLLIMGVKVRE